MVHEGRLASDVEEENDEMCTANQLLSNANENVPYDFDFKVVVKITFRSRTRKSVKRSAREY